MSMPDDLKGQNPHSLQQVVRIADVEGRIWWAVRGGILAIVPPHEVSPYCTHTMIRLKDGTNIITGLTADEAAAALGWVCNPNIVLDHTPKT